MQTESKAAAPSPVTTTPCSQTGSPMIPALAPLTAASPSFPWALLPMILIVLGFWASSYVGIKSVKSDFSPTHLAGLRYIVASLVLLPVALIWQIPRPRRQDLPRLVLLGFLGITVYNLALNHGQKTLSAGAAALLINTAPIFTALLAVQFLGERLSLWGWLSLLICLFGVTLIALGEGKHFQFTLAVFDILLAAFVGAAYLVFQKPLLQHYPPLTVACAAIWSGTLLLLPGQVGLWAAVQHANWVNTSIVIYLGVFPAALGYVLWSVVLSRMPASQAANFIYLIPGMTIALEWLSFGEIPPPLVWCGGISTLFGVLLFQTYGRAKPVARPK